MRLASPPFLPALMPAAVGDTFQGLIANVVAQVQRERGGAA